MRKRAIGKSGANLQTVKSDNKDGGYPAGTVGSPHTGKALEGGRSPHNRTLLHRGYEEPCELLQQASTPTRGRGGNGVVIGGLVEHGIPNDASPIGDQSDPLGQSQQQLVRVPLQPKLPPERLYGQYLTAWRC